MGLGASFGFRVGLLGGRPLAAAARPAPVPAPLPGGPQAADPIDLATGLYVRTDTDLHLPGATPIKLIRTYRTLDSRSRAFGIGANL